MAQQEVEFDGNLWFFVEADSPTARNLSAHPAAGVSLSSNDTWVSLSGTGEVLTDPDRARELWNPWVEAWLPQGPDDPSVALIHFRSEDRRVLGHPGRGASRPSSASRRRSLPGSATRAARAAPSTWGEPQLRQGLIMSVIVSVSAACSSGP